MSRNEPSRSPIAFAPILLLSLALAPVQAAGNVEPRSEPPEQSTSANGLAKVERVPLPSLSREEDHPFTIEIPLGWGARRDLPMPGVLLGPPTGDPNNHPDMLLVRESEISMDSPDAVLDSLRANAEAADWSLLQGEVRDFGGVPGLWIVREMPPSGLHGRRVNFAVKLPKGTRSLDVTATVSTDDYDAVAPRVESMLRSLRPAESEETPPDPQG